MHPCPGTAHLRAPVQGRCVYMRTAAAVLPAAFLVSTLVRIARLSASKYLRNHEQLLDVADARHSRHASPSPSRWEAFKSHVLAGEPVFWVR